LYPLTYAPPLLKFLGSINPVSYQVDLLRYTLINQHHFKLWLDVLVVLATMVACMIFAVRRFNRIQA